MPNDQPIERSQLLERISGKNGLFCMITDKVDKEVLDCAGIKNVTINQLMLS